MYNLEKVYFRACDKTSPSATLCEDCKKKYFDYICSTPGIFGVPYLVRVDYIPWLSYADNLVYAYNIRFGEHQEMKKEETTMQITYNGFTGELVKLEQCRNEFFNPHAEKTIYDLSVYDREKRVTHHFTGVKLGDVKFLCGEVTFGG